MDTAMLYDCSVDLATLLACASVLADAEGDDIVAMKHVCHAMTVCRARSLANVIAQAGSGLPGQFRYRAPKGQLEWDPCIPKGIECAAEREGITLEAVTAVLFLKHNVETLPSCDLRLANALREASCDTRPVAFVARRCVAEVDLDHWLAGEGAEPVPERLPLSPAYLIDLQMSCEDLE